MTRMIPADVGLESAERPPAPLSYRLFALLVGLALIGLVFYQATTALVTGARPPTRLVVYGFSTQEEVFDQGIFPAFEESWKARTGREVALEGIFGPSGTLANQIVLGAPADVAVLSNAQHVTWLQVGRQLHPDTRAEIIGCSPIVIVTRPGNPAGIRDYSDLARPGIKLLHAEPGASGAGDWAVLAEYGSAYLASGDRGAAEAQLQAIWSNVTALGASARAALTLFELGVGDALVTYEQDALLALERGVPLEIVVPPRTIVAQHMAVLIDANVTAAESTAAEGFIRFLTSKSGQALLGQYHLRPPEGETGAFAAIAHPFTVEDLGGWSQAYRDLIEGVWQRQVAPRLETDSLPRLVNGRD